MYQPGSQPVGRNPKVPASRRDRPVNPFNAVPSTPSQRGHILLVTPQFLISSIMNVKGLDYLVPDPKESQYLTNAFNTVHPEDIQMLVTIALGYWAYGHQHIAHYRRNWGLGFGWVRAELDATSGGIMELETLEESAKKWHERDVKSTTLYRLLTPREGNFDLSSFSYTKRELGAVISVLEGRVVLASLMSFVNAGNRMEPNWEKSINTFKIGYSNIGDEGVFALAPFFSKNTSLQNVDLSFVNFSPKSLKVLSKCISDRKENKLTPILTWFLHGNNCRENLDEFARSFDGGHSYTIGLSAASITTRQIEAFLAALPASVKLKHLNVSNNDCKNWEGTGLVNREVKEFEGNGLQHGNMRQITTKLLKGNKDLTVLKFSHNSLTSSDIQTILQSVISIPLTVLSLCSNPFGDVGCQLVAASLTSFGGLIELDVSFCQISSKGISSLSRNLLGVETLKCLNIAGNSIRTEASICLSFALAHHPRVSKLIVDNCSLSKVAQCYLVSGIASNRWVPMKFVTGFKVGHPMAEIGVLLLAQQGFTNEVCFKIQRDNMLNSILSNERDEGVYERMMSFMTKIPFDDDELMNLRKYFYDDDPVLGSSVEVENSIEKTLETFMKNQKLDKLWDSSEGLKHQNDTNFAPGEGVGLDLNEAPPTNTYGSPFGMVRKGGAGKGEGEVDDEEHEGGKKKRRAVHTDNMSALEEDWGGGGEEEKEEKEEKEKKEVAKEGAKEGKEEGEDEGDVTNTALESPPKKDFIRLGQAKGEKDDKKSATGGGSGKKNKSASTRIRLFPQIRKRLEEERGKAKVKVRKVGTSEAGKDAIAQAYANSCLCTLRQLRYHCMSSKLDGWRHAKNVRKVLIADDSLVTRKLLRRAFEKANCVVDVAENGDVAYEKMKMSLYDTVFMDLDMPVLDGIEATRQLRKWEDVHRKGARQPICALTSAVLDDAERRKLIELKEAGLDVFESKPANVPRLMKVVDDVADMFSDLRMTTEGGSGG